MPSHRPVDDYLALSKSEPVFIEFQTNCASDPYTFTASANNFLVFVAPLCVDNIHTKNHCFFPQLKVSCQRNHQANKDRQNGAHNKYSKGEVIATQTVLKLTKTYHYKTRSVC